MIAKIIALQFRVSPASVVQEQVAIIRELGEAVEVTFVNALDTTVVWDQPELLMADYHGVLLGGSGDFDFDGGRAEADIAKRQSYLFLEQLRPLFQYLFAHDIPTLGICYGHQLLGAFAGAQVKSDPAQKKTKSHQVRLMVDKSDYFLFSDLPEEFFAHYGHKDALDRVPDGAVLLMSGGEACRVSALRYKENIYTTQFHPELTFVDMIDRMKSSPGYLPEGVLAEELFSRDAHSNRILQNFGKLVTLQVVEKTVVN